jgi:hypothetical protein
VFVDCKERSKLWKTKNVVREKTGDREKIAGSFRTLITKDLSAGAAKIEGRVKTGANQKSNSY